MTELKFNDLVKRCAQKATAWNFIPFMETTNTITHIKKLVV